MMIKMDHTFHMVDMSPWPILASFSIGMVGASLIGWMNGLFFELSWVVLLVLLLSFLWWRDVSRESSLQGLHSNKVVLNMKWGMILFILSEVLFFVSFFWTFFHSELAPNEEISLTWPSAGIVMFNPMQVPLLNTIVLLSSGVSVTWAHHSVLSNVLSLKSSLIITIFLGSYFTFLQGMEYMEASFSMEDSICGSIFFMATGFHGIHVLIGTIFLTVMLFRASLISSYHHFGFEAASWYWHFVDVVWLFLYMNLYW